MAKVPAIFREIAAAVMPRAKTYQVPSNNAGGWYPIVREPWTGAWQRNQEIDAGLASTFYADFACKTLIAHDIAKLGIKLMQRSNGTDIWTEVDNPAYSPVLRKPNHYQTSPQFWENWILSKLSRGNAYILKVRDARRVVVELYVLDPRRVTVLVADDGSVFYELFTDELRGLPARVRVPSTEIIHDRMNCDHPLVGIPPIFASGLAAMQGLNIQNQSARLFANNAQPGGIITAPGHIEDDTAGRIREDFAQKFGGANYGRLAVMGDGMKYERMSLTAVEGQLVEQMKLTAEIVCSTYHVPAWKIGVGARPSYNTAQQMNEDYYSTCIQSLLEQAEACLDEGLGIGKQFGLRAEFDIDNLLRMDAGAQAEVVTKLVGGGIMTPNEGRSRFNLVKLSGGDTVYMQQQDIPLSVAASVKEHPLNAPPKSDPNEAEDPETDDLEEADDLEEDAKAFQLQVEKQLDMLLTGG